MYQLNATASVSRTPTGILCGGAAGTLTVSDSQRSGTLQSIWGYDITFSGSVGADGSVATAQGVSATAVFNMSVSFTGSAPTGSWSGSLWCQGLWSATYLSAFIDESETDMTQEQGGEIDEGLSWEIPACEIAAELIRDDVKLGMTADTVRRLVGKPLTIKTDSTKSVWMYSSDWTASSGPSATFSTSGSYAAGFTIDKVSGYNIAADGECDLAFIELANTVIRQQAPDYLR